MPEGHDPDPARRPWHAAARCAVPVPFTVIDALPAADLAAQAVVAPVTRADFRAPFTRADFRAAAARWRKPRRGEPYLRLPDRHLERRRLVGWLLSAGTQRQQRHQCQLLGRSERAPR